MITALAVSVLLAAPPAASAASAAPVDSHKVFALGMALSAGAVFRMDSMPADMHANGIKMIEQARALSAKVGVPFPDDAVFKGPQSDTMAAMGYVMGASGNPITRLLQERHGRPTAALFELGLLSYIAATGGVPSPGVAKDMADLFETAGRDSGVPREQWIGLVEAYRTRKTESERMDAMAAMIQTVGRALRANAAATR